jgi:dienelactone hydrolase
MMRGDLSAQMVAGVDQFLMRSIDKSVAEREQYWTRDLSSADAYEKSLTPNRKRLSKNLGVVEKRLPVTSLEYVSDTTTSVLVAETVAYSVYEVRWQVLQGVYGEGLLLQPKGAAKAHVVALPDADQTPEMLAGLSPGLAPEHQFARRLAEQGCLVVVPVLINRDDTWSGSESVNVWTNQTHREWVYRQAFEMGRHVIGYEVQKVLGLVDWFSNMDPDGSAMIGVAGYAEGGLLALYCGALDTRIDSTLVSGYFSARERVWEEPIYRNVMGLLQEFGDAELAAMIVPRTLVVEHSNIPVIGGPPTARQGRKSGAAPGKLSTPAFNNVEPEFRRGRALVRGPLGKSLFLVHGNEGKVVGPGSEVALMNFLKGLGSKAGSLVDGGKLGADLRNSFDPNLRQQRQVQQLVDYTQNLLRHSEYVRADKFWNKVEPTTPVQWEKDMEVYKKDFWDNVIGRLPPANVPANSRSRLVKETDQWTCYEIVLDVYQDVFAWGYMLVPKDIRAGEKRPVVVCQHGLEGLPKDTIDEDPSSRAWGFYKAFAARLAERGFVTFAPHNLYRGRDDFRVLQRKLNPLGKTLFSVIIPQHDRILDFLSERPFVDPERIGFYGLSYGGKTAMRVPSLLERYALSICSADFNEWVKKNVTTDWANSYVFKGEYEIFEYDMGHTYNYAEMSAMIAPRPFMVERGHNDGVAPDEWVAYEYAKVRRLYGYLGIPERTDIEFFNGPHTINGQGTFRFLHQHLNWPEP